MKDFLGWIKEIWEANISSVTYSNSYFLEHKTIFCMKPGCQLNTLNCVYKYLGLGKRKLQ